jgi:TLD
MTTHFYGMGESFVFTFEPVTNRILAYRYTGENDKIQFSDERCIILGGGSAGSKKSEAALFINKEFQGGHSGESDTFFNQVLSGSKDFTIIELEVWGFDSI